MRSSIPSGWTLRRTRELFEILFAADKLMLKEMGSPYLFIIYSIGVAGNVLSRGD